jgi:hypothetical protein
VPADALLTAMSSLDSSLPARDLITYLTAMEPCRVSLPTILERVADRLERAFAQLRTVTSCFSPNRTPACVAMWIAVTGGPPRDRGGMAR